MQFFLSISQFLVLSTENLPGSLPVGLGCESLGKFSQKIIKTETLSRGTAEMVAQTSGKTQRPHKKKPVESLSHPWVLISTSVASRQCVQTQLWGPGVCTHILVTRLAQATALGKTESFFLPFPLLHAEI